MDIRAEFEKKFPVPHGVYWNAGEMQYMSYIDSDKCLASAQDLALYAWRTAHKAATEAARGEGTVPMPETVAQARGMILVGMSWIESNVPGEDYTQPPAPAVPDERVWFQVTGRDGLKYTEGWNDCRAAMLKAQEPKP